MGMGQSNGKLIWMGEHAAVYGYPAFVFPVKAAKMKVTIHLALQDTIHSPFFSGLLDDLPKPFQPIHDLYHSLKKQLSFPSMTIEIESNIPMSSGMGSSAALAAALTRACYDHVGIELSNPVLEKWIHQSEVGMHGNPSGVDGAQMISSTPILFEKGQPIRPFSFQRKGYLLAVFSTVSGSTKQAVASVKEQTLLHPERIHELGALSKRSIHEFSTLSLQEIGNHMKQAHDILCAFGLSHPKIDEIVQLSYQFGSLGSKISGGGLGGMVLCLFDQAPMIFSFEQALEKIGYTTRFKIDLERDFI